MKHLSRKQLSNNHHLIARALGVPQGSIETEARLTAIALAASGREDDAIRILRRAKEAN